MTTTTTTRPMTTTTTTRSAELVREALPGFRGRACLYRLTPAFTVGEEGGASEGTTHEWVVVSSSTHYGAPEALIFPATPEGVVVNFGALGIKGGSFGTLDHRRALRDIGYTLRPRSAPAPAPAPPAAPREELIAVPPGFRHASRSRAFAAPRGGAAPLLPEWCARVTYGVPVLDRAHESGKAYRKALASALRVTGGLSFTSKMPGASYSIPAEECLTGSKLRGVPGSACASCYALKARYLFPVVRAALRRRFRSLKRREWVPAMAFLINHQRSDRAFRWHDAGDLQSLEHLERIAEVARLTPFVDHWIPSREYAIAGEYQARHGALPRNLTLRLSAHMVDGPAPLALAKRVGAVVSTITTSPERATCPAPSQGGQCLSCRACWSRQLAVAYLLH